MKNFKMIAALAVAVAATSCSQDDLMGGLETGAQDNGAIGVNTFIANGTRGVAYNDVVEFREANGNFDLYAWEKLADDTYKTPAFMDGVAFVMGTDNPSASTWYYEDKGEVRFWQELQDGSTVDFYAVSPKDVEATIEAETQTIEYTVADNSADQVDLMYARTTSVEPGEDVKKNGVHLDFNHALSQIVFKAKTRDDYVDYVSAEIKEVKVVNVANSGTFTFGDASYPVEESGTYNDEAKQPWSSVDGTAEYTAQIGWTETEGTEGTTTNMAVNTDLDGEVTELTNSQSALILMPQTTTAADVYDRYTAPSEGAYFAVTCQVVYHRPANGNNEAEDVYIVGEDSEDESVKYKTLYFPLETTWNAGYKYTYTFVFSADVADPITINEDLYVGPWGDGGETEVEVDEDEKVGEDALTQAQLNARLIANQFASANAASITAGGVTFIENENWPTSSDDIDITMYYSHTELSDLELLTAAIPDDNGNYWRVPTYEEYNMLVFKAEALTGNEIYSIGWSGLTTTSFKENVTIDGQPVETNVTIDYLTNLDAVSYQANGIDIEGYSVGAIRFDGTKQHAAYKYSPVTLSNGLYALEITIKGLKSNEEVTFDQINTADFWTEGDCFKVVLPALGNSSDGNIIYSADDYGAQGNYLTSDVLSVYYPEETVIHSFYNIEGGCGSLGVDSYGVTKHYPVRMIQCDADGNLVLE